MKEILKYGFEILESPRKVNQYLRGELYLYVDSILSLHLNTTPKILEIYYDFMSLVFSVIRKWLEIFPTQLSQYYEMTKKYPKLYLVDFNTALSRCGYEMIDIMAKCFGLCPRCNQLFAIFDKIYLFKGEYEIVKYNPIMHRGLMYSLMNLFGEQRGLESFKYFLLGSSPPNISKGKSK